MFAGIVETVRSNEKIITRALSAAFLTEWTARAGFYMAGIRITKEEVDDNGKKVTVIKYWDRAIKGMGKPMHEIKTDKEISSVQWKGMKALLRKPENANENFVNKYLDATA